MEHRKRPYKLLTESYVERKVRGELHEMGYGDGKKDLESGDLQEHGVDIKVKHRKYGRYFLVEAKGDPKRTVKHPHGSRNSSMNSALGQIVTRMHSKRKNRSYKWGYKYGVAFPYSFANVLKRIPYDVCSKLNLYIFIVHPTGNVDVYDHRRLKKLQHHDGSIV